MGEMEDTEFDDVLDDWFIESLKTYKDLHVYQLEHPTQVLEWTSGKTVCVAGYSSSKNEILELCLPMKILADENKGLCAERDFKVSHGGFTDGPVRCLTHIPGTRCAVTNDGLSSDLQVWDLGGDESGEFDLPEAHLCDCTQAHVRSTKVRHSARVVFSRADVIRRTGSITGKRSASERGSRIAARPSSTPQVLHGDQVNDIQLTELTSGQTLYKLETDSGDPLSSLQFVSDAVFLAGCCNGKVYVADTRMSAAPQLSPSPSSNKSVTWGTDGSAHPHLSSCRVVRVSSSGLAVVSDLRNLGGAESRAQLDIQTPGRCSQVDVKVSWAPALGDCISVSGFSGVVQIYNSRVWRAELQEAQPLFEHRGHVVSSQQTEGSVPAFVTSHVWHPERPRTLLSAASDGSVHVWDWVDPDRLGGSPPPEAK